MTDQLKENLEVEQGPVDNNLGALVPEQDKDEKELRLLEKEFHKLQLVAAILEQRAKIKQIQSYLKTPDPQVNQEEK